MALSLPSTCVAAFSFFTDAFSWIWPKATNPVCSVGLISRCHFKRNPPKARESCLQLHQSAESGRSKTFRTDFHRKCWKVWAQFKEDPEKFGRNVFPLLTRHLFFEVGVMTRLLP